MEKLTASALDYLHQDPWTRPESLPATQDWWELAPYGQPRAFEAMAAGLELNHRDYHIFVAGPTGTGRRSFVKRFLEQVAPGKKTPCDLMVVYNFQDSWVPNWIELPAGKGRQFREAVDRMVERILRALEHLLESEDFRKEQDRIRREFEAKEFELRKGLLEQSEGLGFRVVFSPTGMEAHPLEKEGSDPDLETLESKRRQVFQYMDDFLAAVRRLEKELETNLEEFTRYSAHFAIDHYVDEVQEQFPSGEGLSTFFEGLRKDVLENMEQLMEKEEQRNRILDRYRVNLFLDRSECQGAPVVFENNPTFSNLFGKIEYVPQGGYLTTDHTLVRSGSIHRADKGYLVMEAADILRSPELWEHLKKSLYNQQLQMENLEQSRGVSTLVTLKPHPREVDLKVILIGEPDLYDVLFEMDSDFQKLFRVKVEFDEEMPNNTQTRKLLCSFATGFCRQKGVLPLSEDGLRSLLFFGMKLAGSAHKLSTQFSKLSDLLIECDRVARSEQQGQIDARIVEKARMLKENRVSLEMEKIDQMIGKGEIHIQVAGYEEGQINALSVVDLGDFAFGVPTRVTATYSIGSGGIMDIQQEVEMSGKIYKKAALILESYIESMYARKFPLSIKATIAFEQTYAIVEGDSATIAEALALISALSGVPVKQGIAVTGSMSQRGEAQAVGGISEKVNGFFRVCQMKGLSGEQGVVLPSCNVDSLVLEANVVQAIAEGVFHLWAVDTVDEALQITTGKKAGTRGADGEFPEGSVHRMVSDFLELAYHQLNDSKDDFAEEK
ncbi:MAG TPA: ATP-binding protein [Thermotogota bacterium]|nr:ATP-binding protein [Thermotogota bacterium]HRW93023.1 ATP-binding protein [Thermotogota bacterium]